MSWRLKLVSWLISPLLVMLTPSLLPISGDSFSTAAQVQTTQDQKTEADDLLRQAIQQFQSDQYLDAIQSWQQALAIYQKLKARQEEAFSLIGLGSAYASLGQYPRSIEFYQQSSAIFREINNHAARVITAIVVVLTINWGKKVNNLFPVILTTPTTGHRSSSLAMDGRVNC